MKVKKRTKEQVIKDLTDKSFSSWSVINPIPVDRKVLCRCECSLEVMVLIGSLESGKSTQCKSCGLESRNWINSKIGSTINSWKVIKKQGSKAECICECGTVKLVEIKTLRAGTSKSCGCQRSNHREATNMDKYGNACSIHGTEQKKKKLKTWKKKYGVDSPAKNKEVFEKIKKTHEDRYGGFGLASDEIRERADATNVARYGGHPTKNPKIKEKIRKTSLERFGYDSVLKCPKTRKKIGEANIEKYGVDNPFKSKEIKKKIKKTNLERYGHENPMGSPEIREKTKATFMKNYGVDNPFKSPEIREKILQAQVDNDYTSKGERELRDWIESTFNIPTRKSYCGGANPCEIDIHIPDKNISIEYNGDMFHSEFSGRGRDYHLSKTKLVREQKNTQLIHIFESEWKSHPNRVKAFLSGKLQKGKAVRASKCKVVEVDWDTAKKFCNEYHLQGKPSHSVISLGLEFEGKLLSLMTFSKPHRQKMGDELNLSRYVIKPGYRIHGGLSKLSKASYGKIGAFITFVHKRLSNGKSYEKSGYEVIDDLKPDYWYWDIMNNKVVSKQSRQKRIVGTPKEMTEKQHAEIDGLFRIWDCGKIKFRYKETV